MAQQPACGSPQKVAFGSSPGLFRAERREKGQFNFFMSHTLHTSALVHETYLKIVDQPQVHWHDRAHFFQVASWAMRRILVDYARRHRALRRGGGVPPLSLEDEVAVAQQSDELLALDEALERLAIVDERLSQVEKGAGLVGTRA